MRVPFAVVLLVALFGDVSAGCDGSWSYPEFTSLEAQDEKITSCSYSSKTCVEFSFELEDADRDDYIDILVTSDDHCAVDAKPFDELSSYTAYDQNDMKVWNVNDKKIEHKANKFCVIFKCDWSTASGKSCDRIQYRYKFKMVTCARYTKLNVA